MGSTFSLVKLPRNKSEFKLANNTVLLLFNFPIKFDFAQAIQGAKDVSAQVVGGPFLIAFRLMCNIIYALPYNIAYLNGLDMTKPLRLSYTNMPGPK